MPNLNAALGCAQMERLDEFLAIKTVLADQWGAFFDHYDVRFLLEADPIKSEIIVSDESHDVKWIPISKVKNYNSEGSIKRMVDKTFRL